MLTYSLEATYQLEPACDGLPLEHVLDLVAEDLHPHPVHIVSDEGGVTIGLELRSADVREVYGQVARVLERCVAALREHWPHCAGTMPVSLSLLRSSQRIHTLA